MTPQQIYTQADERGLVRELAYQVAEIAASRENDQIQRRWRDVNGLRKPDRAPVWCRPVGVWAEILPDEALECSDPRLRGLEAHFRRILIKHDIRDDSPVDPWFLVPAVFDVEPANRWGVDVAHQPSDTEGGAWGYAPPLKTEADFDYLRLPVLTYNEAETQERLDRLHDAPRRDFRQRPGGQRPHPQPGRPGRHARRRVHL